MKEEGLRLLSREDRVTATEFQEISEKAAASLPSLPYLLIDVRPALETTICRLPNSFNLPFESLEQRLDELKDLVRQRLPLLSSPKSRSSSSNGTLPGGCFEYLNISLLCSTANSVVTFQHFLYFAYSIMNDLKD